VAKIRVFQDKRLEITYRFSEELLPLLEKTKASDLS
jgi:hypothetical protein